VTPDAGAQEGGLSPADGSGPRELLRYRSAQGRWVVAAMILGASVARIDSTVVTFVVNGALGGFAFVFIPALEIIAGYSPVVAGSALVPVTVVTLLLSGASGRLAQRIGPRPPLVAGCLLCTVASLLAVRIGPHAGYWTAVLPVALLFGLGLASLLPPLTASAMNSAPDSLAGLASGVNNAVARVAGLLWIAALPPITGLTGAAYADPVQFRFSFAQISPGSARQRSPAPRCSPQPLSPGPAGPPRYDGRRSFRLRCPTSPARSLPPRTGTNPQTEQQPNKPPLPCRRYSFT
jgi:hypothetical protein